MKFSLSDVIWVLLVALQPETGTHPSGANAYAAE